MSDLTKETLVELITKEVLKRLADENFTSSPSFSAKPVALLAGEQKAVPEFAKNRFAFRDISAYEGDIAPFEAVLIARISFTELADAALGKDASKLPCAVTNALLSGKEVYLLEAGLPYKKYKRTVANRNFYNMLEGYVNTLRTFGVKVVKEQWQGNCRFHGNACPGKDTKGCPFGPTANSPLRERRPPQMDRSVFRKE